MLAKCPGRLPVVCEKAAGSDLPGMVKNKLLVPESMAWGELNKVIFRNFDHVQAAATPNASAESISLLANGTPIEADAVMSEVYERHKLDDNILYVTYSLAEVVAEDAVQHGLAKERRVQVGSERQAAERRADEAEREVASLREEVERVRKEARAHEERLAEVRQCFVQEVRCVQDDLEKQVRSLMEERRLRGEEERRAETLERGQREDQRRMAELARNLEEVERCYAEVLRQRRRERVPWPVPAFLQPCVEGRARARSVNVGVVGAPGVGKTSLIGALLRRAFPTSPPACGGACAPTSYEVRGFQGAVRMWELPGPGANGFPAESYMRDVGMRHMDAILFLIDGACSSEDAFLLQAAALADIPCHIVRTKVDLPTEDPEDDFVIVDDMELDGKEAGQASRLGDMEQALRSSIPLASGVHLVTTLEHFWEGARPLGRIDALGQSIREHIEAKLADAPAP